MNNLKFSKNRYERMVSKKISNNKRKVERRINDVNGPINESC